MLSHGWSAHAEGSRKSLQSVTESDLNGDSMSPVGGTAGSVALGEVAKSAEASSNKRRMRGGFLLSISAD